MDVPVAANVLGTLGAVCNLFLSCSCYDGRTDCDIGLLVHSGTLCLV
jgi:hypothetical protein